MSAVISVDSDRIWATLESSECLDRFDLRFSCSSTDPSTGFRESEPGEEKQS